MKSAGNLFLLCVFAFLAGTSCKKDSTNQQPAGNLHLSWVKYGSKTLALDKPNTGLPVDSSFTVSFNEALDTASARAGIILAGPGQSQVAMRATFSNGNRTARLAPFQPLAHGVSYAFRVTSSVKGAGGETFPGVEYNVTIVPGKMTIASITLNGADFKNPVIPTGVDRKSVTILVSFSHAIDTAGYQSFFDFLGGIPHTFSLSADHKSVTMKNTAQLSDIQMYGFAITNDLKAANGFTFDGFFNYFYTEIDSTPKFPAITDNELLTLIQQKTFRYFYDFGHSSSGMARERETSGDIVTTGGSGFGVMALIVGMERNFITRDEGMARLGKILTFLESCDRYHGAWPHWLNGSTGKTVPFSPTDDGADLVETSYMVQGLLTMRQYLDAGVPAEQQLAGRINVLLDGVEYDWFTRNQHVLYWHWSPDFGWQMNMPIRGYNETLITYIVAATSVTHPIIPAVYHEGYARNGGIKNGSTYYGYVLPLGEPYGGPLFFTHYSFLGLNPHNLVDAYADYWQQNVNQSLINYSYCVQNPKKWIGYSNACWGLTASDNPWGYNAHSPTNDLGVITPTAAISALPYTPEQSMKAIRFFYYTIGNRIWGDNGFYDAFDMTQGWWGGSRLAIDQGPEICMIENYRSGLLWNLFMSCPEVQAGLTKLGFTYKKK